MGQLGIGGNWPPLDLTSPVRLGTIPAGAFFSAKMTTPGFDEPCAAGYYSRSFFCFSKTDIPEFQHVENWSILMFFVSFDAIFPQCPPDLSRDQLRTVGP